MSSRMLHADAIAHEPEDSTVDDRERETTTMSRDWGTWRDAEQRKYVKGLDLTIAERLAWLDEMIELARAHGAQPKPRDEWGQPIESKERHTKR